MIIEFQARLFLLIVWINQFLNMFRKVMTIQKEASERLEDAKAAQMKQTNLVERLQVYPINIHMIMVKVIVL